ncbi:aromatic ring-hydroxylating dioxygenase subunit alpha [Nodosilinea sp. LEGE 07088]|uniref:aromatic ring-hydroxylating dioxygenase subunit alpha n=1 Tax=Nodosilinea sp. LEGE 07088 TaxID=2777968 RepID=UPI0018814D73|nr:aromatic ring-hydroxylating dioxygenase subunit alpha [Nodosilinea sp. LEGE 07088]MBE9137121.1 aromatic ring-hydroxylating dioxygenase subunit alpha [Nodosilinea sp. LEGE 07088]
MLKNFWYAVEFSAAIADAPKPVRLMGEDYVLYRGGDGQVVAMRDRCIHRGASLSGGWVEGNCIRCPYHGWRYEADGTCVHIPADQAGTPIPKRARIDALPVAEHYGMVWLFVGDLPADQRPPIPALPEYGDPAWRAITGEYTWNAHYTRVVESGLDSSHAPFVHSVFFNLRDDAEVPPYEVQVDDWSATARTISKPPKRAGLLKLIVKRDRPFSSATLTAHMPNINRIHLDFNFRGYQYIYFASNIPVDENTTLTKWIGLRNFLPQAWADWNSRKNTNDTYLEDKAVIESQVPRVVPLTGEILLASDSLQLAYRKLIRQCVERGWAIGSDYGVPPVAELANGNGKAPAAMTVG